MPDRRVVFAENNRISSRGLKEINPAHFLATQRQDDNLTYTLDFAAWLGTETIASVTRTASGPTVAGTSNTTTQVVQRLKGTGYVDIEITTSGSQVLTTRLEVKYPGEEWQSFYDYGRWWG